MDISILKKHKVKVIVLFCGFTLIYASKGLFPSKIENLKKQKVEKITEESILNTLDSSIIGDYNDFIDLGHGYFELANCRLTLFKDKNEWAIVFEKFGYNARAGQPVQIQINYFGNCLRNLSTYNDQTTNMNFLEIENNIQDVLNKKEDTITIRGKKVKIPIIEKAYQKYGINWDFDGTNYIGAVLKYLSEEHPDVTRAKEEELKKCLPSNLQPIMVLDSWYQEEYHQFATIVPPSKQETFKMLAKVIVTGDTNYYEPKQKPNTHWTNYPESGGL